MKFFRLQYFLFIILAAMTASCRKGETEPSFLLSEQEIQAPPLGLSRALTIDSSDGWTAEPNTGDGWVRLSPSKGDAGKTLATLTVDINTDGADRTTSVNFLYRNRESSLKVTQSWQAFIALPTDQYHIDSQGGNVLIYWKDAFEVTLDNVAECVWIKMEEGTMKILPNLVGRRREAEIRFSSDKGVCTVLVVQDAASGDAPQMQLDTLIIDGVRCQTDKRTEIDDFYYPVDIDAAPCDKTVTIEFKGNDIDYLCFGDDPARIRSGQTHTFKALPASKQFPIYCHNDRTEAFGTAQLVVTGVPIVSIEAEQEIVNKEKRPCQLSIIDPKARNNDSEVYFTHHAEISYRGSGALRYPKKPYSVKLIDEVTGDKFEAKLLGMRKDNSWILDAMWLDLARMRNRVCFDLWNEFNELYYKDREPKACSGTHGFIVEVFLNGNYHGMYTLSDRLDRKQLKLKKGGGYLYKTRGWESECTLTGIRFPYDNSKEDWGEISIDYPTDPGLIEFKYYEELIRFVSESGQEEFASAFADRIDMSNTIDMFLFINLISAWDNLGRNMYWGLYDARKSTKMIPLVWDMDGTLGRTWNQLEENPRQGLLVYNRHNGKDFRLFKRILEENPDDILAKIKIRWKELRKEILTDENFAAIVDEYTRQQLDSGACGRETNRWPQSNYGNITSETDYMKDWFSKRLKRMDELIETL